MSSTRDRIGRNQLHIRNHLAERKEKRVCENAGRNDNRGDSRYFPETLERREHSYDIYFYPGQLFSNREGKNTEVERGEIFEKIDLERKGGNGNSSFIGRLFLYERAYDIR